MYFFYLFDILVLQFQAVYHGRGYLTHIVYNNTVTFKYETPTEVYHCFWKQGPTPSAYFTFDVDDLVNNPADSINSFGLKQRENGVEGFVCARTFERLSMIRLEQLNEKQEGLTVEKLSLQFKRDREPQGIIYFNKETMVSCVAALTAYVRLAVKAVNWGLFN